MDLLCRAGRHSRASQRPVWNNGYWFSRCRRCGCDLIRRGGGRWRAPPKGYRVVWRPRRKGQVDWNGLIATRPPAGARARANRENGLPAPLEPISPDQPIRLFLPLVVPAVQPWPKLAAVSLRYTSGPPPRPARGPLTVRHTEDLAAQ